MFPSSLPFAPITTHLPLPIPGRQSGSSRRGWKSVLQSKQCHNTHKNSTTTFTHTHSLENNAGLYTLSWRLIETSDTVSRTEVQTPANTACCNKLGNRKRRARQDVTSTQILTCMVTHILHALLLSHFPALSCMLSVSYWVIAKIVYISDQIRSDVTRDLNNCHVLSMQDRVWLKYTCVLVLHISDHRISQK